MGHTIRDVAEKADVSVSTVSRVFNRSELVKEETLLQVRATAEEMGYHPDPTARSLNYGKTETLGVVFPALHGEFFPEIIRGLDEATEGCNYHVLLSSSHYHIGELETALRMMAGRVDGMLIMAPGVDAQTLTSSVPLSVPAIFLITEMEGATYPSFTIDNYGGAREVTEHLLELGHRRIAVIAGPDNNYDVRERFRGYHAALKEADVDPDPTLIFEGAFTQKSGYEAGRRLAEMELLPDAVFAFNDYMALGAMLAFRRANLHVPSDFALAGFDDVASANYSNPSLTSVHVPTYELGHRAMKRLIAMLDADDPDDGATEGEVVLPVHLKVRESTG